MKMKSLEINGQTIPVSISSDLSYEDISKSIIFSRWVYNLSKNFIVNKITIHKVFYFGKRVGFILAEADAYYNNKRVPGITLLRGDSVSIMPVLRCNGETYSVTVTEPRIPIAKINQTGFPCGMIDDDEVNVAALKELSEEVGTEFNIKKDDLIHLGKFPLSSGGCDEYMILKAFEMDVSEDILKKLHNRINISEKESEQIHVKVIKLSDIKDIETDARSLLSYFLWKQHNEI